MVAVVASSSHTMTLQEQAEVRHRSVGTKVLMVGLAVFAVLGSFWTIVWFIRAYVEAPRVNNAPMALAARETTPVVPAAPSVASPPVEGTRQASVPPAVIMAAPAAEPAPAAQTTADTPAASGAISDRWLPLTPAAPSPAPPEPTTAASAAPDAVATTTQSEPLTDEVAESSVPAISGTAPLPRR